MIISDFVDFLSNPNFTRIEPTGLIILEIVILAALLYLGAHHTRKLILNIFPIGIKSTTDESHSYIRVFLTDVVITPVIICIYYMVWFSTNYWLTTLCIAFFANELIYGPVNSVMKLISKNARYFFDRTLAFRDYSCIALALMVLDVIFIFHEPIYEFIEAYLFPLLLITSVIGGIWAIKDKFTGKLAYILLPLNVIMYIFVIFIRIRYGFAAAVLFLMINNFLAFNKRYLPELLET